MTDSSISYPADAPTEYIYFTDVSIETVISLLSFKEAGTRSLELGGKSRAGKGTKLSFKVLFNIVKGAGRSVMEEMRDFNLLIAEHSNELFRLTLYDENTKAWVLKGHVHPLVQELRSGVINTVNGSLTFYINDDEGIA